MALPSANPHPHTELPYIHGSSLLNSRVLGLHNTLNPQTAGAFSGLRLLPGKALAAAVRELHASLAEAVMAQPIYEMRWLKNLGVKSKVCVQLCTHVCV